MHAVVTDLLLALPPYTTRQRQIPTLSEVNPGDVANRPAALTVSAWV